MSFLDQDPSDESTLSLPDADQGPHPRTVRGWAAFTNLTFQSTRPTAQAGASSGDESEYDDADHEDDTAPKNKRRRHANVCGLSFSTRLIGGRQYCAKCTKQYKITDPTKTAEFHKMQALGVKRTEEELYMLRLYHGKMPELYEPTEEDYAELKGEFLAVESEEEEALDGDYHEGRSDTHNVRSINARGSHKQKPRSRPTRRSVSAVVEEEPMEDVVYVEKQEAAVVLDESEMDVDEELIAVPRVRTRRQSVQRARPKQTRQK